MRPALALEDALRSFYTFEEVATLPFNEQHTNGSLPDFLLRTTKVGLFSFADLSIILFYSFGGILSGGFLGAESCG
jgi:hypothetical protein